MRWFILAVGLWLSLAVQAGAVEPRLPDAIYRFEIGEPSLEALNLVDGLGNGEKSCSFKRQESDGSVTRVVLFSDKLAAYLATLQMPSVMLTFKLAENTDLKKPVSSHRTQVATIHGRDISDFQIKTCVIRKEDEHGKASPALAVWVFREPRFSCP